MTYALTLVAVGATAVFAVGNVAIGLVLADAYKNGVLVTTTGVYPRDGERWAASFARMYAAMWWDLLGGLVTAPLRAVVRLRRLASFLASEVDTDGGDDW